VNIFASFELKNNKAFPIGKNQFHLDKIAFKEDAYKI
jgi:hypothetical protein